MALMACAECGKNFSSLAKRCPHCEAKATLSVRPRAPSKSGVVIAIGFLLGIPLVLLLLAALGEGRAALLLCRPYFIWAFWGLPICAGHRMGTRRGQPNVGALVGFVGGWIGILLYWCFLRFFSGRPTEPAEAAAVAQSSPPKASSETETWLQDLK